ncbi:PROBABLE MEMBRANE PROTEIN [Gulosibacter sp. 10]|nr:PROBABLE MEMBRANE PROTEIN [Gulosibacter sp. 10]
MAGFGRRIAALVVDWGLAMLIGWLLFDYHPVAVSASFLVLTAIGIWLIGGSIGHTILGMRVNTLDGRAPGPWRPWVRQLLLAAVIPALVMDEDQRGMHELLSGTVLRRFR